MIQVDYRVPRHRNRALFAMLEDYGEQGVLFKLRSITIVFKDVVMTIMTM